MAYFTPPFRGTYIPTNEDSGVAEEVSVVQATGEATEFTSNCIDCPVQIHRVTEYLLERSLKASTTHWTRQRQWEWYVKILPLYAQVLIYP